MINKCFVKYSSRVVLNKAIALKLYARDEQNRKEPSRDGALNAGRSGAALNTKTPLFVTQ
jgi:hypothetical protein